MLILHKHRHAGFWLPKRQPSENIEIDWNHPIAHQMTLCFLAQPGGMVDLANRTRLPVNTPTSVVLPSGVGVAGWSVTNAQTTDLSFTTGPWAVGAFTHLGTAATTSGANPEPVGRNAYTSESVNTGFSLYCNGGTSPVWGGNCYANNAYSSYSCIGVSAANVGDVFLGQTSDGLTIRRLMVNGIQENSVTTNLNPVTTTAPLQPLVASPGAFDGSYMILAWTRDVSVGEWAWLAAEPYCFLRPRVILSTYSVITAPPQAIFAGRSIQIWDH